MPPKWVNDWMMSRLEYNSLPVSAFSANNVAFVDPRRRSGGVHALARGIRLAHILAAGEREDDAVGDDRRFGHVEVARNPCGPDVRLVVLPFNSESHDAAVGGFSVGD